MLISHLTANLNFNSRAYLTLDCKFLISCLVSTSETEIWCFLGCVQIFTHPKILKNPVLVNYCPFSGHKKLYTNMVAGNTLCCRAACKYIWHPDLCILFQISPEDIRWEGEDPGINRGGRPGQGRGIKKSSVRGGAVSGAGRGRGTLKGQAKKELPQNGIGKKGSGDIELLHTDTLIKEVTLPCRCM